MILDFEGEPARSLARAAAQALAAPRRRRACSARSPTPLNAVEFLRGASAAAGWVERARAEFVAGYQRTVDPTIVPPGREAFERLLSVFELEKAVYELRYELTMRPDWVPIPVAGILRILEEEPVTT